MHTIYLLLGSNLGDRLDNLFQATELIGKEVGTITKSSSVYETASWGKADQPDYLNQVLMVQSEQSPDDLLRTTHHIEQQLGRARLEKWGSRTMDIDILFYDQEQINQPDLIIPHPLLHTRKFTLSPLNEIAPYLMHPVLKLQISEIFSQLLDNLHVYIYNYEDKDI